MSAEIIKERIDTLIKEKDISFKEGVLAERARLLKWAEAQTPEYSKDDFIKEAPLFFLDALICELT